MSSYDGRRVRGWILHFLSQMPVDANGRLPLDSDALTSLMRRALVVVSREQAERELAYLSGPSKGYVELEKPRRGSPAAKLLGELVAGRLTPRGQDLIDGSIDEDPGVELPGRWA